jgi:hypothetical protein
MTKETKQAFDDRFTREMTETASGMHEVGVMDDASYKMTMCDLRAVFDHAEPSLRGAKRRIQGS